MSVACLVSLRGGLLQPPARCYEHNLNLDKSEISATSADHVRSSL